MSHKITIQTKNNLPEELETKRILEQALSQYSYPIFSGRIIIEKNAMPHSHPIITLNCFHHYPVAVMSAFVHEQFHWFFVGNKEKYHCLDYLEKELQRFGRLQQR